MARKTFDVRKYKLRTATQPLESFELEELTGDDELAAWERAGTATSGLVIKDQMITEAIVAVNAIEVVRPFVEWRKWPSRTRDFVRAACNGLNDASQEELDDFRKAAFGD